MVTYNKGNQSNITDELKATWVLVLIVFSWCVWRHVLFFIMILLCCKARIFLGGPFVVLHEFFQETTYFCWFRIWQGVKQGHILCFDRKSLLLLLCPQLVSKNSSKFRQICTKVQISRLRCLWRNSINLQFFLFTQSSRCNDWSGGIQVRMRYSIHFPPPNVEEKSLKYFIIRGLLWPHV